MTDETIGKTYVGTVYVRPCARGISLVTGDEWTDVEDWIADIVGADRWTGAGEYRRARITVERLPDDGRGEEGAG